MRLRRLCLEIFALRRFFKEPVAGVSVDCASEAQAKHRLSKIANAFAPKSRVFDYSVTLPAVEGERGRSPQRIICAGRHVRQSDGLVPRRVGGKLIVPCPNADGYTVRIPHSTAVVAAACLLANAFGVLSGRIKTKKRLDHPSHKAP